jgi:hypothetical protein
VSSPQLEQEGGKLLNIGEKCTPLNGQWFIRYSGLWGSLSKAPQILPPSVIALIPQLYFISSGYWNPAFNETGMRTVEGRSFTRANHIGPKTSVKIGAF